EIVEIVFSGVLAEIRAGDVGVAEIGHHAFDVLYAVMDHAEPPAGEPRIAAALFFRRALDHCDPGALLGGREGCAQRGIASSDHNDIKSSMIHSQRPVCCSIEWNVIS